MSEGEIAATRYLARLGCDVIDNYIWLVADSVVTRDQYENLIRWVRKVRPDHAVIRIFPGSFEKIIGRKLVSEDAE